MIHVGIEMSRDLRLSAGKIVPPGTLEAGGVNLLRHALTLACRLTEPSLVTVLTIEPDEAVLELVGEFECREAGVMQWVATLVDAAPNAKDEDAVVILRQTAPLRNERPVISGLARLKRERVVVSGARFDGAVEPVRAFEIWRLSEFGKYGYGGPMADPPMIEIAPEDFVEINRREDYAHAAAMLTGHSEPGA